MRGHSDTVTGMEISPDGSYLLTNAMDNTCKQINVHLSETYVEIFHYRSNLIVSSLHGPVAGNYIFLHGESSSHS